MTDPTPSFTAVSDLFTNTWSFGTEWLIPLVVAIVAMALITKDVDKWKILALPIFVIERIVGMPVHFVLIAGAVILFVVEALSLQVMGNVLRTVPVMNRGKRDKDMEFIQKDVKKRTMLAKYNKLLEDAKKKE